MAGPFLDAIRLVRETASRHGFRIALIGGFALPFHGVRRATGDVDFLIDASGASALHEALTAAGSRRSTARPTSRTTGRRSLPAAGSTCSTPIVPRRVRCSIVP
ncbi:hypothetical protein K2Z84_28580 [Candidatus Binatia bacterium]|nr:hypothetical protein [Candidatus Binatia bacterium]